MLWKPLTVQYLAFNSSARLLATDTRNKFSEEPGEIPEDMGGRDCESGMGKEMEPCHHKDT